LHDLSKGRVYNDALISDDTSTNVFPAKERPYYRKGMWISCAFCLLVTACSITLSLILRWENSKMEADGSYNHEEELGEMRDAPNFDSRTIRKYKYIL